MCTNIISGKTVTHFWYQHSGWYILLLSSIIKAIMVSLLRIQSTLQYDVISSLPRDPLCLESFL